MAISIWVQGRGWRPIGFCAMRFCASSTAIESADFVHAARRQQQPMRELPQLEPREESISAERLEEQRRARKAQQASYPFGRDLRLCQSQYFIAPPAQVFTVLFI